jgi:hypothetical protein
MNTTIDQRIAEIARRQHGVVARGQLLAEGLSPRSVSRRLAAGRLHQLHLGVYFPAVDHLVEAGHGELLLAGRAAGPRRSAPHIVLD